MLLPCLRGTIKARAPEYLNMQMSGGLNPGIVVARNFVRKLELQKTKKTWYRRTPFFLNSEQCQKYEIN